MKKLVLFGSGLVSGCLLGWAIAKNYFEDKFEKECDELYDNMKYYEEEFNNLKNKEKNFDNEIEDIEETLKNRKWVDEDDTLQNNQEIQSRFEEKNDVDDEDEFVENEETEDEEINQADLEAFEEHQKNKNRPPEFITQETFENLPAGIDSEALYYYATDNVLVDENEEEIENPELLVGTLLEDNPLNNVMYVMNYALDTCYEVMVFDKSWWNLNEEVE